MALNLAIKVLDLSALQEKTEKPTKLEHKDAQLNLHKERS